MVTLVMLPNKVLSHPAMYPNLGLLYIASSLEQAGYAVQVADLRGKEVNVNFIPRDKFIGFSATTGEIKMAKTLNTLVKYRDPDCKTIIGGAHASLLPEDCKGFDYVVIGEGEQVILDIIRDDNQEARKGQIRQSRLLDLDNIPFPARHLADSFSDTLIQGERCGSGEKATGIIFSRGCPYNCAYCANIYKTPVIYRSPENIVAEIKYLISKYNCHNFRVDDDNITLNKSWALELCEQLIPLGISFRCHTRPDLITEELVIALKKAGCIEIGLGLECADQDILNRVNKKADVYQYAEAIGLFRKHGILSKVFFVLHLPGETDKSIELNKNFMACWKPDKWTLSRFAPYPGCAIYKDPESYDIMWIDPDFSHYWNFWPHALVELQGNSVDILDKRYRDFYTWLRSDTWRH